MINKQKQLNKINKKRLRHKKHLKKLKNTFRSEIKHNQIQSEVGKLEGDARVAKVTAENAKKALQGLRPAGPKIPEKGFMVSVEQPDIGEGGRDPPLIDFIRQVKN